MVFKLQVLGVAVSEDELQVCQEHVSRHYQLKIRHEPGWTTKRTGLEIDKKSLMSTDIGTGEMLATN